MKVFSVSSSPAFGKNGQRSVNYGQIQPISNRKKVIAGSGIVGIATIFTKKSLIKNCTKQVDGLKNFMKLNWLSF